jgi:hypothetical protein
MATGFIPGAVMNAILEAWDERQRAHKKHGDNSIESVDGSSLMWLAILGEEIGEVTEEMMTLALTNAFGKVSRASTYDQDPANRRKELIQVIGVAWAWVNAIDNAERTKKYQLIKSDTPMTVHKATMRTRRDEMIADHHHLTHGICVHGELPGQCENGGY